MRRLIIPVLSIGFIISVFTLSLFGQPVNSEDAGKKEFAIEPGESVDQIANSLSQAKLIRSRLVFKIAVFRLNLANKIQAGYFYLSPSLTTTEIAKSLTKASAKQIWVTIPEGLRREEVANLILDKLATSKMPHRFDPEEFIRLTVKLEGHLFPDTYALAPNVTTGEVVEKLTSQFDKVVTSLITSSVELDRVLVLASLVEREAGDDSERPEIAAIIHKRAVNNWPLQVDATVQYAISSARCRIRICDWWPKELTKTDLATSSPYNTYKNTGLPPGPIDNPGRASLAAAANVFAKPKDTKYWFYLHDPEGKIHYAVTIEEHNANICTYLKKDCP